MQKQSFAYAINIIFSVNCFCSSCLFIPNSQHTDSSNVSYCVCMLSVRVHTVQSLNLLQTYEEIPLFQSQVLFIPYVHELESENLGMSLILTRMLKYFLHIFTSVCATERKHARSKKDSAVVFKVNEKMYM